MNASVEVSLWNSIRCVLPPRPEASRASCSVGASIDRSASTSSSVISSAAAAPRLVAHLAGGVDSARS